MRTPVFMFRLRKRLRRSPLGWILLPATGLALAGMGTLILDGQKPDPNSPETPVLQEAAAMPTEANPAPPVQEKLVDRMEGAANASLMQVPDSDLGALPPFEIPAPLRSIDGSTFRRGEDIVRIAGIDGPRAGDVCLEVGIRWSCGLQARAALHNLVAGRSLFCQPRRALAGGGMGADCRLEPHSGLPSGDVGHLLVAQGWARPQADRATDFAEDVRQAQATRAGLWRGGWTLLTP